MASDLGVLRSGKLVEPWIPKPTNVMAGSIFYFSAEERRIKNRSSALLMKLTVNVFSLYSEISNCSVTTPVFRTAISTRSSSATLAAKALTEA